MRYITIFAKNWWSLAVRGLVAILFGLATLALPGLTLSALVLLFGVYALIDGAINIAGAWRASRAHVRWGTLLLQGLAGILAGAITLAWPAITALALIYLIAAWSLVIGLIEIVAAIRLREFLSNEWLLALSGVLSLIFGVLLLVAPLAGALAIALWIGVYALIFGVVLIALGFRVRNWAKKLSAGEPLPSLIR
jgi:uncharacterized membrane protein HdeD (DUF308 family)